MHMCQGSIEQCSAHAPEMIRTALPMMPSTSVAVELKSACLFFLLLKTCVQQTVVSSTPLQWHAKFSLLIRTAGTVRDGQ
jgi:hypothetical protein